MPNVAVLDMTGKKVGDITLSDAIFGIEPNNNILHAAVVNYLANQRQGTQSTLTRSEVSGGGKKPWRQKGTGHARQGSTRAPQWTHGGIALGPKPRDYSYSINKKEKRLAMKSAFSTKAIEEAVLVIDSLELPAIKTADMAKALKAIGTGKKTLVVLSENNENVYKSARNIPGVKVSTVSTLNVYDILNADSFVADKNAVAKIEEVYA